MLDVCIVVNEENIRMPVMILTLTRNVELVPVVFTSGIVFMVFRKTNEQTQRDYTSTVSQSMSVLRILLSFVEWYSTGILPEVVIPIIAIMWISFYGGFVCGLNWIMILYNK